MHTWNKWQEDFTDEIYKDSTPFKNEDVKLSIVDAQGIKREKCDCIIEKDKVILGDIEIDKEEISGPNIVFYKCSGVLYRKN